MESVKASKKIIYYFRESYSESCTNTFSISGITTIYIADKFEGEIYPEGEYQDREQ